MSLFNRDSFTILRMNGEGQVVDGIYQGAERIEIPAKGNIQPKEYGELEIEQRPELQGKDLRGAVVISSDTQMFPIRNSDLIKADIIAFENKMFEVWGASLPYKIRGKTRYQADGGLIEVLDDNTGEPVIGDPYRPHPYNQDVEITGLINDDNKVFILAQKIKPGSLELFNGSAKYLPTDYTLADDGITVTLNEETTAPSAGDPDNGIPADVLYARGAY